MGFEVTIPLNLKSYTPEEAKLKHIEIAREGLRNFLLRDKTHPQYKIVVDGLQAGSETQVRPFGTITYVFLRMSQVGKLAIKTARELSPVASGKYKKSWILVADGKLVGENEIPDNTNRLVLVNNQPYARKIHVRGARIRQVPPGIVEKVKQIVSRQYSKTFVISMAFIELADAYVLKRDYVQVRRNGKRRLHTKAGRELTYPAVIINQKYG